MLSHTPSNNITIYIVRKGDNGLLHGINIRGSSTGLMSLCYKCCFFCFDSVGLVFYSLSCSMNHILGKHARKHNQTIR